MTKRIVYTVPDAKYPDAKLQFLTLPDAMLDPNSLTRIGLREKGIDFANDDEVYHWVAKHHGTNNLPYHLVDEKDCSKDESKRYDWYYHPETNSVRDS